MSENKAVMGVFVNRAELEQAVNFLSADGFRSADVSALLPTLQSTQELSHGYSSNKVPEGAAVGGAAGAVIGGALGWLAGIGMVALPGAGAFLAAGPLMAALAGAGVGSTAGGLAGALIGFGFPEYEAHRYEGMVKDGAYLISVHCEDNDWARRARRILEECGARDISVNEPDVPIAAAGHQSRSSRYF